MPTGLFSLYIRSMALYEKNPGNDKSEKFALWTAYLVASLAIIAGMYGLYVYVPMAFSERVPLDWVVLNLALKPLQIIFGIAVFVYYKKGIHLFSRPWIYGPAFLSFVLMILKGGFYLKPTYLSMGLIAVGIIGILFFISCMFYHRKKYPEEIGLRS